MKIEELAQLQPVLFERFAQILQQNRLNHAYLFTGAFGSFEMVQCLAQSLFCTNKNGVLPCGECRNCRLIEEEDFSDVTVVRPINHIIKTERVRELVRNFSQLGFESNKQVFIICDAEKMHVNAANSLLKVIEEPQSEVYIFLLTADENLILPTIKSRAQRFHFPKNEAYLLEKLEQAGVIKTQAELLTAYSQTEEEALRLAASPAFFELVNECERFVSLCLHQKETAYLQVAKLASLADDKEKQGQVLKVLEILFAKEMATKCGRYYLDGIVTARKMWQANVSFQNALEYMVLQERS
ncbi:DNA polymerase III subunit tau [Streptococcus constellatus]|uniref:DNA polymerase III subunit tau n=1 Tax=Streptococcus constellatus TaxID=76860 RepID=A0A564TC02_STRCV|nr:DNA polymerase III subunit delta' [Streptococcus constellatus]VUW94039.1 DNA polymerase III subunit tau [Streptococcus gordonii]VUX04923.1 DNA polymerase III subunit tau [Streptococcus constellatus]